MNKKSVLLINAFISFVLALLLGISPEGVIIFLGLPVVSNPFYAGILGGVFYGIGTALLISRSVKNGKSDGLGLRGAVVGIYLKSYIWQ